MVSRLAGLCPVNQDVWLDVLGICLVLPCWPHRKESQDYDKQAYYIILNK